MDTTELQTKLTQLTQLLPSQRECLDRLLFQLAFNQHHSIRIVGSVGSGKTVMALAMAELFSDKFNVALLDSKTRSVDVSAQLMKQWFNRSAQPDVSLAEQLNSAVSVLPLLLIIDDADHLPATELQQLHELDCLMFCFASEEGEDDDITLLLNKVTTEDASQLLQHQQLNELDIAQRLAQADGNMHLLMLAADKKTSPVQPEQDAAASKRFAPWLYAAAALLIVGILGWFYSASDTTAMPPAVSTKTTTSAPAKLAEVEAQKPVELSVEPEVAVLAEAKPTEAEPTVAVTEQRIDVDAGLLSTDEETLADTEAESDAAITVADAETAAAAGEAEQVVAEVMAQYTYNEPALLAMDRQAYAVQLAVLSSDAAYQRFELAYPALPVLAYSRSWQGQKQIVLLLASFSDKATAKAQIATLPSAITATGPFIKSLQAVQTEIKVRQSDISAASLE